MLGSMHLFPFLLYGKSFEKRFCAGGGGRRAFLISRRRVYQILKKNEQTFKKG